MLVRTDLEIKPFPHVDNDGNWHARIMIGGIFIEHPLNFYDTYTEAMDASIHMANSLIAYEQDIL